MAPSLQAPGEETPRSCPHTLGDATRSCPRLGLGWPVLVVLNPFSGNCLQQQQPGAVLGRGQPPKGRQCLVGRDGSCSTHGGCARESSNSHPGAWGQPPSCQGQEPAWQQRALRLPASISIGTLVAKPHQGISNPNLSAPVTLPLAAQYLRQGAQDPYNHARH